MNACHEDRGLCLPRCRCLPAASHAVAGEWRFVLPKPGDPVRAPAAACARAFAHQARRRQGDGALSRRPSAIRPAPLWQPGVGPDHDRRSTRCLLDDVDLYVDADRNRRIEAKDRLAGEGRTWRSPLAVAVVEGETTKLIPRAAIFRLGATGLTFSFAAAGYLEGTVSLGGATHAARRTDGDGNGFLTDAQDRLWIDLNDDGRWDPADEQFLYSTILALGYVALCRSFRRARYAIGARGRRRNWDRAAQPEPAGGFAAYN